MAYVVVVFAIMNSAALAGVAWWLWTFQRDLATQVQTAIQDEVRRQDDRIEKRLARTEGTVRDSDANTRDPTDGLIQAGRPVRRRFS